MSKNTFSAIVYASLLALLVLTSCSNYKVQPVTVIERLQVLKEYQSEVFEKNQYHTRSEFKMYAKNRNTIDSAINAELIKRMNIDIKRGTNTNPLVKNY